MASRIWVAAEEGGAVRYIVLPVEHMALCKRMVTEWEFEIVIGDVWCGSTKSGPTKCGELVQALIDISAAFTMCNFPGLSYWPNSTYCRTYTSDGNLNIISKTNAADETLREVLKNLLVKYTGSNTQMDQLINTYTVFQNWENQKHYGRIYQMRKLIGGLDESDYKHPV